MPIDQQLIENIRRGLVKRAPVDKYIKILRNSGDLDILIKLDARAEVTLLMYYAKENQYGLVKALLTGKNPANPAVKNREGLNALMMAILASSEYSNFNEGIIDELLKTNPSDQLMIRPEAGTPLYMAVLTEQPRLVQKFLAVGPVEQLFRDSSAGRSSPLHLAAEQKSDAMVNELLKHEPEKQLLQKNQKETLPIHAALSNGNKSIAQKFLAYATQAQITYLTSEHETLFDYATIPENYYELIEWLLTDYPQLLELRSVDGFTLLHRAVDLNQPPLVKLLLQKGAIGQITAKDDAGHLPITSVFAHDSAQIARELLQYDQLEQLTADFKAGNNILHLCCLFMAEETLKVIVEAAQKCNVDLAPLLLKPNDGHLIPLHILLGNGFSNPKIPRMVKSLLEIEANKQLEQPLPLNQRTPLLYVLNRYISDKLASNLKELQDMRQVVKLLLDYGPTTQLEHRLHNNLLPLEYIVGNEDVAMTKILLPYHTEQQFNIMKNSLCPPLHVAIGFRNDAIFQLLIESKLLPIFLNTADVTYNNTPLHVALSTGSHLAVTTLLEKKADVNISDKKGWTSLHIACWRGNSTYVSLLIAHGAKLQAATPQGETPLHIAVSNGNTDVVETLLEHFAPVGVKDHRNATPLFFACISGHTEIAMRLINAGANVNESVIVDGKYITPLFLALQAFDLQFMAALVKAGADVNQPVLVGSDTFTIAEFIKLEFSKRPQIYEHLRKLFPQLPKLKSGSEQQFTSSDIVVEKQQFHPRQYLKALGYSDELIAEFEEERKRNKQTLLQNRYEFQFSKPEPKKLETWLDNRISSEDDFVFEVENPRNHQKKYYCYLDIANLTQQGLDIRKLNIQRLKFSPCSVKKLDDNKSVATDSIKLTENSSPQAIKYTHEVKINKLDRVLLFKLKGTNLYIGTKFVQGGFHTLAQVNAFQESIKSEKTVLTVQWPHKQQNDALAQQESTLNIS